MNKIQGVNGYGGLQPVRPQGESQAGPARAAPQASNEQDQVEISQIAQFMSKIASMPDIRSDKVESIRQAISNGTYDVDARLSEALDMLIQENLIE